MLKNMSIFWVGASFIVKKMMVDVTSQKYTNENEALMCLLTHTDPTSNPNKKIKNKHDKLYDNVVR